MCKPTCRHICIIQAHFSLNVILVLGDKSKKQERTIITVKWWWLWFDSSSSSSSDAAEGDSGSSASYRRHPGAQSEPLAGRVLKRRRYPSASGQPAGAVEAADGGGGAPTQPAGGGPQSPAVLLWRCRGRGLDERAGAVHDVRGEGQGGFVSLCGRSVSACGSFSSDLLSL